MASSTLFKLNSQTFKSLNPSSSSLSPPESSIFNLHFSKSLSRHSRLNNHNKSIRTTRFFVPLCSSLPSPSSPPISKEEAILQAKTCLTSCLIKPLNNPKLASPKLKKLKQPRFRLEIPILDDDSPSSLSQLASSIFHNIPISRRGSNVKLLFLWPNSSFIEAAVKALKSDNTQHIALSPVTESVNRALKSADVAILMAPEKSQLDDMRKATEAFATKPVVMINPRWLFEEEKNFGDEFNGVVGSFEVIYAFTGLEVRGVLSKRKGVIFKCVRDGVLSGERWNVLVEEEEGNGSLKVVSQFKARPSMEEVELVLYNLMAMNSPITKSAKFLKDLVSNITGKK